MSHFSLFSLYYLRKACGIIFIPNFIIALLSILNLVLVSTVMPCLLAADFMTSSISFYLEEIRKMFNMHLMHITSIIPNSLVLYSVDNNLVDCLLIPNL